MSHKNPFVFIVLRRVRAASAAASRIVTDGKIHAAGQSWRRILPARSRAGLRRDAVDSNSR